VNSSNSNRLVEIAEAEGVAGRLIDDASALRDEWFPTGEETVLLTAGASAPEDLVAGVCRTLVERHGGSVEVHDVFAEDVEFNLPAALRREMKARQIEGGERAIHVATPDVTREAYGAVPLTVSARR